MNETKKIPVLERVSKKNEQIVQEIRTIFREHGIICFNIMGSPGGGKTTLIEK
ncbi:MAG: hydrogenase nickel incorporation protein HypB, partial [Asgard group archaeon]|nr:hydrogenase nickel incorporation protein HypB [Asgard group archaeon]